MYFLLTARVPPLCSYHVLTSPVICYCTDPRPRDIYLSVKESNYVNYWFANIGCFSIVLIYSPPVQTYVPHRQYGLRTVFLSYTVSGIGKLFRFRRPRKLHIFSFGLFHDARKQPTRRPCCQTIGVS